MTETKVSPWAPQEGPQALLVNCPVETIVYGGARGGGKTVGMILKNCFKAQQFGRHQKGIFFRKELPQLEAAIETCKEIYLPLGWKWAEQKKTFTAPNGATLKFRPLERDSDAEKYQGMEFTDLYFEELTNWADNKAINRLRSCLRSAKGVPCQFHATCNPGGPGHQWVKAWIVDPNPAGYEVLTDEFGGQRIFIPAKVGDNKELMANDPTYVNRIKQSGSAELVRAWLDGDWNIVEGAFFDCWSSKMVHRPFLVPQDWTRIVSFDWGSAKPFSVGWWAIVTDDYTTQDGILLPRGYALRYREWYGVKYEAGAVKPDVGLRLTAEAVGDGIRHRTGEKIHDWIADPAIFKEDGGPSQAERMDIPFRGADNTRVGRLGHMGGWDQMRSRMVGTREFNDNGVLGDGLPMIGCFNTCKDSIRTIPSLQHDINKPEDLATNTEDHCFAGHTLVDTTNGQIQIKDLPEEGFVNTVDGIMSYRSARLTKRKAEVVRVVLSNGKHIICTPEHKFLASDGEWCYARDLEGKELTCVSTSYPEQFKSSTVQGIISAATTSKTRAYGSIAPFGNGSMAQYPPSTMCITPTTTGLTMGSGTLSAYLPQNIFLSSMDTQAQKPADELSKPPTKPLVSGTAQKQGENGTQNIGMSLLAQTWSRTNQRFVSFAEKTISQLRRRLTYLNTATKTAKPLHCVRVEKQHYLTDVYCITVPVTESFCIEGGVVVHNCADEWRYFCMARPMIAMDHPDNVIRTDIWDRAFARSEANTRENYYG